MCQRKRGKRGDGEKGSEEGWRKGGMEEGNGMEDVTLSPFSLASFL